MKKIDYLRAKRIRERMETEIYIAMTDAQNACMSALEEILLDYIREEDKPKFLGLPWE